MREERTDMEYNELREIHRNFYYHNYEIAEDEHEIQICYDFEIENLSHFNPTFILQKPDGCTDISGLKLFREAAFSLGMVELVSYWKITCPPQVIVECGKLDETQVRWWKKLYYHGLGEFFYINHVETDMDSFMELKSTGEKITGKADQRTYHGNLIPVGGGKDSFVSLEVLAGMKEDNHAFVINHVMSAVHSAEAAGYEGKKLIIAERTLDSRMLDFNRQGYLNGHTPFSALAAFAAYLTAIVYGKKYICLSNEASANESTIHDSSVNHQYSKTFEFEEDFRDYCRNYLSPDILYFSLLRPLSELQITGIFSSFRQYHRVFRSCNVGSKTETWCARCAKCLFVGIMLGAYLDDEDIIEIFGRDMLNDPEMMELFEQLTGILDDKPFECVGTREEVNTAVCMSIRRHLKEGKELPLLYRNYMESRYYDYYRERPDQLDAWNIQNLVPEEYQKLVREKLGEIRK